MTATEKDPMTATEQTDRFPAEPERLGNGSAIRAAAQRDDATRYLCAAAHIDRTFADLAIREFLTEPLRATPPSPAVDAAAVLREAGAARRRRMLRDWVLLGILLLLLITRFTVALAWFLFGFGMAIARVARAGRPARLERVARSRIWFRRTLWVVAVVLMLAGLAVLAGNLALTGVVAAVPGLGALPSSVGFDPFGVALSLLALAVLVLDQYAVSYLLTRSFRRGMFTAHPGVDTWPGERWVRGMGHRRYQRRLERIARATAEDNLTAYRDYDPFVGAGAQGEPLREPIQLQAEKAAGDTQRTEPFTLAELYDHVTEQLLALREAPSLAPSARLAELSVHSQVVVPVGELLQNLGDPATRVVLPSLEEPPSQTVPPDVIADVTERSLEWMRYYRCFRVETWSRDVTVSMYLHFGVSERMLYFEWIPYVLYPIADSYRVVDRKPLEPLGPLRDAMIEWMRLPGSLPPRIGPLFRRIRPIAPGRGVVLAAQYGSSYSLRELAAAGEPQNYFQDADITRYVQLLTGRTWRAIGEFLEQHGIEVTDFMSQAAAIGDQYTFNGPVYTTSVGSNNRVQG
ncbi:MAG TPA: hypothetical protein VGG05_11580 [Pseudonocardiaceae bacterium]|jgi:hypothetical protein